MRRIFEVRTGIEVPDEKMEGLNLVRDRFTASWNHAFKPAFVAPLIE